MELARLFCTPLADIVHQLESMYPKDLQEIRIRIGRPLMARVGGEKYFISRHEYLQKEPRKALCVTGEMLIKSLELMSNYSLFAFENEMRQGYITVEGGHRIGLVGRAVVEGGQIRNLRHIAGLNVRIAHEVPGCADAILPHIKNGKNIYHTLIVSPPGCGKTTLLRDLIRQTSDKLGLSVGVVDERSEIAGCYRGIPQCDVGRETDVLDGAPKAEGMLMLLRCMSPQVIAVDELGSLDELAAVTTISNAGVKLLCTVHSNSLEELQRKIGFEDVFRRRTFERVVILSGRDGPGTVERIYETGAEA